MFRAETAYGTGHVSIPRCLACDAGDLHPDTCPNRNDKTRELIADVMRTFAHTGLSYHEAYDMLNEIKAALQVQAERVKLPSS